MTGMINPDGSIGPIGGIIQKLDAAFAVGAKRFLIPQGQATYTEMVTETISNNGWIQTVTKPITRNVQDYAINRGYDVQVIEVSEISQVVENFTGNQFIFEEAEYVISTEEYITSMKPIANRLLNNATDFFENSNLNFEKSNIPNSFPNYYKNDVRQDLEKAEELLQESEEWYNLGLYYTSMSKSFQSLIYSRYVNYAIDFFEIEEEDYLEKLLTIAQSLYNNNSEIAENAKIEGFITLQSVGAAQERASEARIELNNAKNQFENLRSYSDVLSYLEKVAFVIERCNSVEWWINIGLSFNDTSYIKNTTVKNLALEYIQEAQQAVIYSSILLSEFGGGYTDSIIYLNQAEEQLETARDDFENNLVAAALFEALNTLVKANLAIELIGTDAESKISFTNERASNNIAKIRKQGIEPILAVSYYEYAESLKNESSYNSALSYYKYSGMIAGVLGFTNITSGSTSSRFVGIPSFTTQESINWFRNLILLVGIFLLGCIAGIGLGVILSNLVKRVKSPDYEKQNIKYIEKPVKYEYPHDQIPRSIRDYFRKKK
jgi:uncharacterized protein